MKTFLTAVIILVLALRVLAQDTAINAVTRAAHETASATLAGDYQKMVNFLPKPVITAMGGREAAVATLKQSIDEGRLHIKAAEIGEPGPIQKFGASLVCLVPEKLTIAVEGGTLTSESYLIGISGDHGRNWVFADSSAFTKENETQIAKMFPEFGGKLTIPEKKEDVFKAD